MTQLRAEAARIPGADPDLIQLLVCAREHLDSLPPRRLAVTASDIFQ